MEPAQKINPKVLRKEISRRYLLRNAVAATATGIAAGVAVNSGLGYVGKKLEAIIASADREVAELTLDVKSLCGALDKKLARETEELKKHYTEGRLKIYEERGIATPAEIKGLEEAIKQNEEFAKHYNFAERAKIFKDRLEKRFLEMRSATSKVDARTEKYQVGPQRKFNEYLRKIAGMKTGKEGELERKRKRQELESAKNRMTALCKVYDTNEDNRIAELEVTKGINQYLKREDLSVEERELYDFLKQEYAKQGSKTHLREFIQNYDHYDPNNQIMLKLRASLQNVETIYGKIQENREYMDKLHGILQEGILLKTKIREQSNESFARHEEQIGDKVNELRSSVDGVISELESKGYDIKTRQEIIDEGVFSGPYTAKLKELIGPIKLGVSGVIGAVAGLEMFGALKSSAKTSYV